ncbi:FecCD family ABC transporter permease [Streptomyces sp. NPDC056149]|uniref:FecCD family ABC transporter permease n=1 Tax=unclassified Streptomyces TaxID=2593676 RepID=UPI0023810D26|nr:iron ABC transporter permease [Streptomyces sp. WZ-12]
MTRYRYAAVVAGLAVLLLAAATCAVALGSVAVPPGEVWRILAHRVVPSLVDADWPRVRETIVLDVRMPRVLLGATVGAGLSVCGMALQALVRNPLADPGLLGISSGAGVGAVLVVVCGVTVFGHYSVSAAAFLGGLAALLIVYALARAGGRMTTVRLILAGVATGQVLSAVASFLIVTSDQAQKAQSALQWMLGGLGGTGWDALWLPAAAVLLGTVALLGTARHLNVLLAGDEAAAALGLDVGRFRALLFVLCALLTGVMVAVSGAIGFVGLMMPHITRLLVGANHRRALPVAALLGAVFLIGADLLARTVISPEEIPVGIVTALAGGPTFLWLMYRKGLA